MKIRYKFYDIETTPQGKYAVGCVLLNKRYKYFFSADEFVEWVTTIKSPTVIYIHNMKFDIEFHFSSFFKYYPHVEERKAPTNISFSIDKDNTVYGIYIHQHGIDIKILDFFKLMNFSLKALGDSINLPKLECDYSEIKEWNKIEDVPLHIIRYLNRDCEILQKVFQKIPCKTIKTTIASTTYENWMKTYQKKYVYHHFRKHIPNLPLVHLRNWYRGGIVLHDTRKIYKNLGKVFVYDYNSLYPSIMIKEDLPYGELCLEPPKDAKSYIAFYSIYVERAKSKYIPWVLIDDKNVWAFKNETIYMTEPEFKLFLKSYHVSNYKIIDRYYFRTKWIFHKYLNQWYDLKKNATNQVDYNFSKLMMNSLYGKFGQNHIRKIKKPVFQTTKEIGNYNGWEFVTKEIITRPRYYLPLAIAITSLARCKFLEFYLKYQHIIVYGDTDSFFTTLKLSYDSKELGELKYEKSYDDFILVRKKCYLYKGLLDDWEFVMSGFRKDRIIQLKKALQHKKLRKIKDGYIIDNVPFTINEFENLPLDILK